MGTYVYVHACTCIYVSTCDLKLVLDCLCQIFCLPEDLILMPRMLIYTYHPTGY